MEPTTLVICRCGWQHFGVTRAYATEQVRLFNEFYEAATPGTKRNYGGPAELTRDYETCHSCGKVGEFRPTTKDDAVLEGSTISPVIYE